MRSYYELSLQNIIAKRRALMEERMRFRVSPWAVLAVIVLVCVLISILGSE